MLNFKLIRSFTNALYCLNFCKKKFLKAKVLKKYAVNNTIKNTFYLKCYVGGIASLFGSGNHSSCTLDTKTLLDTLTNEFKTNYTAWVEAEAAEAKNKK